MFTMMTPMQVGPARSPVPHDSGIHQLSPQMKRLCTTKVQHEIAHPPC